MSFMMAPHRHCMSFTLRQEDASRPWTNVQCLMAKMSFVVITLRNSELFGSDLCLLTTNNKNKHCSNYKLRFLSLQCYIIFAS